MAAADFNFQSLCVLGTERTCAAAVLLQPHVSGGRLKPWAQKKRKRHSALLQPRFFAPEEWFHMDSFSLIVEAETSQTPSSNWATLSHDHP